MSLTVAQSLALIVVLGGFAQWVAWRLRMPSILLLLLTGFTAGPVTGLLQPDALFGELLLPFVSLSVGLILFEGGLTLNFREIEGVRGVIVRLVTVGALATWLIATVASRYTVGLDWPLALLIGAILTVTGPTVVLPLLKEIKPAGPTGPILKWEGIVIDPIGVLLAVLVFEAISGTRGGDSPGHIAIAALLTVVVGGGLGAAAAWLLAAALRRYWVPDHLQSAVALLLAVASFAGANSVQAESGLFATTVMGIVLANQRRADIRHIVEFKENLGTFLLSALFILLSARMSLDVFREIGLGTLAFVALLILIARPACVFVSTLGSKLTWRERAFVSWMAPRGIVAAAMTSVFGIGLERADYAGGEQLLPIMFTVIVVSVIVYGLTAPLVARRLRLSEADPQGVLFVGASAFARGLAKTLADQGVRVLLVDTNRAQVAAAAMEGLPARMENVLEDDGVERLDLAGIGRALALTPNTEVNILALQRLGRTFGRAETYRLPFKSRREDQIEPEGRPLFARDATFAALDERMERGAVVKATRLTAEFTLADFLARAGGAALPLLYLTDRKRVIPIVSNEPMPTAGPGSTLISLVEGRAVDAGTIERGAEGRSVPETAS
ncbi:MAG: cation:proton antiporter [Planctomycetota bacterium]